MKKIITVLGTRPEIIKCSPLLPTLDQEFQHILVHTGQHYDYRMDSVFFEELSLPKPKYNLGIGSGNHGEQTGRMLQRLAGILNDERPDMVLVQGDTNSTLAGALAASKMGIPVAHLEAGCRSFNRAMPEEINRVLVDHCAALLLAPDSAAAGHLLNEGLDPDCIFEVGSTAIDACERNWALSARSQIRERLKLQAHSYLVVTIHRAENTTPKTLPGLVAALNQVALDETLVWPMHPRTARAISEQELHLHPRIIRCEPLGYLDMLALLSTASALLTDSGGLQEEAAVLNLPCAVLRTETEWAYLVDSGKHQLVGSSYSEVVKNLNVFLSPASLSWRRSLPSPCRTGAANRAVTLIAAWGGIRSRGGYVSRPESQAAAVGLARAGYGRSHH